MHTRFLAPLLFGLVIGCNSEPQSPKAPTVNDISAMLENADPEVQREAAHWVIQQGPKAAAATPALAGALKSRDQSVRIGAAMALGHVGPKGAKAIPALTSALSDPDTSVRQAAAEALGKLGPAAASALPALERVAAEPLKCNTATIAIKLIRP